MHRSRPRHILPCNCPPVADHTTNTPSIIKHNHRADSISAPSFPLLALPPEIRLNIYLGLLDRSSSPFNIHLRQSSIPTGKRIRAHDEREWWWEDECISLAPNLAEVEAPLPNDHSIFQPTARCSIKVHYSHLHEGGEDNWKPPRSLAQACTTTRDEIAMLVRDSNRKLELHADDIYLACWYGITHSFTSSLCLSHVTITKPFSNRHSFKISERWLTQLFLRFPCLTYLCLKDLHQHKDEERWGSRWQLDDLRVMQFILLNSNLDIVAIRSAAQEDRCGISPEDRDCFPNVEFVAHRVARQHLGDFPYTVDVEEELGKALVKKKRRL
ncbi:uncharacterized protein AB675_7023 [Cyphellophora attinorum]|uniref:Uncharacterized protein n=1 Tax=Cyphellophora attinorum TaxID=1664694 RepID=A0A0N1HF23_9EURO|nr:uncharacterized protein AB675_7023 [Phialophora attinorum]KPI43646.1 hypothetical protein AB675_7023 [Phialophora attinorum]